MKFRSAVRALIIAEHAQGRAIDDVEILLVRFEFPTATVWALPGGGIDADETPTVALCRELAEELGLVDVPVGPHIWNRELIFPMMTGHDGQRDQIFQVDLPRFDPEPAIGWEAMRAEFVHELRWWTVSEIDAALDVQFAPARLGEHLTRLLVDGPPDHPIDVSA